MKSWWSHILTDHQLPSSAPPSHLPTSPAATHVAGFCSSRVKPQLSGFLKCQLFFAEQTHRGSDRARGSVVVVVVAASVCEREGTIGRDGARFRAVYKKKKERGKKSRTVHRLAGPTAWPANSFTAPDG